ncbi:Protein of unknown function DUF262 [Frankia torreyi]|uniref:GmrSD restriction endonucleases N-terminal domain-containing protein n=2 Tax=Frankia TaxID=1854 RepID=A0A0D8BKS6_9ACTN|nr:MULTISPECIES: DUF262 domain-containing protein [Frankia]KJE24604.1 Protein of unknown function DUF262 [Frankia torreyi]
METVPGQTEMIVKPEVQLLGDILGAIAQGTLRIPRFQRPYVWRPDQMLELFDSLERGYPVGSLLVWETNLPLPSLDRVGDIAVPGPPQGTPTAFVLDGHQRLSTLFGTLMRSVDQAVPDGQSDWIWRVFRELGDRPSRESGDRSSRNRYRHWKQVGMPPAQLLPMRSVLRTLDFLNFARRLQSGTDFIVDPRDVENMIDEAEQVSQRIKSYRFAVVRLQGGTLDQAVEVFSRLNSKGSPMTPQQMVSALTYNADSADTLGDRISLILEGLGSRGFAELPSSTVFRAVLAVAGEEDVQTGRWESLARRRKGKLDTAVVRTETALGLTVEFLCSAVGVPLARLVPYSIQVLLLTAFFDLCPEPDRRQRDVLVRWFWSTSWSGFFASANTTQVKNYLAAMKKFAEGGPDPDGCDEQARPFPDRFDMRSARVRTYLLWELQELPERRYPTGEEFQALEELVKADTRAYRHVVTSGTTGGEQSPANRLIMPTVPGLSVRRALLALAPDVADAVLASHGIPPEAMALLQGGDDQGFIAHRAKHLAEREREFIVRKGIRPADATAGETEIDTE